MVGPFIFFDHIGPAEFAPGEGLDVRPHPHIHLATVTYLFEGEILHRDSLGSVQPIRPGAVNWMTAGHGIVHSERSGDESRARRERLHGIQSWVALPRAEEGRDPCFVHHPADTLPELEQGGATLRLVAGSAFGETSPVEVFSPLFYLDVRLPRGVTAPVPEEPRERAVYVASGAVEVGGRSLKEGQMAILDHGVHGAVRGEEDARVLFFGGEPLDGERHLWWNFVSSSQAAIDAAKRRWRDGGFDPVPGDDEFIPLPEA